MNRAERIRRAARAAADHSLNGTAKRAATPSEDCPENQRGDAWEEPHGPGPEPHPDEEPPPQLDEVDAAELAAEGEGADLDFLPLLGREGYIVRGWSHLLAGYPRCGKSELLCECCAAWLQAGEKILFITEEPRSIWRRRLNQAPGPWAGMRLVFGLGALPAALLGRIKRGTESVVILDTIRNLGVLSGDECDNTAVALALAPWIGAARDGNKTLLLTHHMRKGAGDHGEGISGGHALLGAVDVALEIRRDNQPNRRIVRGYARLIQPDELLYEQGDDGRLRALGDPTGVCLLEVRRRVLAAVDGDWAKTSEILKRLEEPQPGAELLRKALLAEARAGIIERDPPLTAARAAGKTVRWRLVLPDET
jgi:hypothetical protein